jgi:hypothetical protein
MKKIAPHIFRHNELGEAGEIRQAEVRGSLVTDFGEHHKSGGWRWQVEVEVEVD